MASRSSQMAPVRGLQGAMSNQDPLGVSTQARSTAGALQGVQDIPFGGDPMGIERNAAMQSYQNSATDPMRFNTMMQAVMEQAPGGIRPNRGSGNFAGALASHMPSTMWQPSQQSAVTGRPFDPGQAFKGLQGAR